MALNRRRFQDWITKRGLMPPIADGFILYHLTQHGPSVLCKLGADEPTPEDLAAHIEREVSDEVRGHVDGWPGSQQYVVRSFAGNDQTGEFAFSDSASLTSSAAAEIQLGTPDQDPLKSNMPVGFETPHAMVTVQQMRHNEGLVRMLADVVMHSRQRDSETISALTRTVEKYQRDSMKTLELIEGMQTRKLERELIQKKYDSDEQRKSAIMGKLTGLVIPAIARQAGIDKVLMPPSKPSVDANAIEEVKKLFLKLPSEMQDSMLEELGEDDAHRLLNIFQGKHEADNEEATH